MGKTGRVMEYKYNEQKWSTHLQGKENEMVEDLREFLWINDALEKKSKYEFVKYCLLWCYKAMESNYPDYKEKINGA